MQAFHSTSSPLFEKFGNDPEVEQELRSVTPLIVSSEKPRAQHHQLDCGAF
jgi:hypothetical protein